ncbi:19122_t:CDS:1, partial [Racocetra persica]
IDFGGGDLKMKFDPTCRCCCIQTSYENPIRSTRDDFEVEDYVAFQVLRKGSEIPNP